MLIFSKLFLIYLNLFIIFFSSLGYGIFFRRNILRSTSPCNIFEIYILSIPLLLSIGFFLHFLLPINYYVSSLIVVVGFILLYLNKNYIILDKKNILLIFLLLIVFLPLLLGSSEHGDFYYHHLPYLNLVEKFKIIFGLVNFNDVLANPYMSWFNYSSLFGIPFFSKFKYVFLLNYLFFLSFIAYLYLDIKSNDKLDLKIINFFLIVLSLSVFSKIKNHGADVPPQLFILLSFRYIYEFLKYNELVNNKILIKIILFLVVAIILRINSVFIFPLLLIALFNFLKNIENFTNNLRSVIFIFVLTIFFVLKNLINTGCLVYPVKSLCFDDEIDWAISKEITTKRVDMLEAISKGWMYYAKSIQPTNNKFIWNPNEEIMNHDNFLKKGVKFWIYYWIKDHDLQRIYNVLLIHIFLVVVLISFSKFNRKKSVLFEKNNIFLILTLLSCTVFWFLKTPQTRYVGYSILICFCTLLSVYCLSYFEIQKKIFSRKIFNIFVFTICFLNIIENLPKTVGNIKNNFNSNHYDWIEIIELNEEVDFIKYKVNDIDINLRKPSNKLYAGNINEKNKFILFCGNVPQLCIPEEKVNCFKKIEKKYGYLIFYQDLEKCRELINKNIIY